MSDITLPITMPTEERENCSAGLVKRLSCELGKVMPALSGESSEMTVDKQESIARCSATSQPTLVANSFVRRMRLLISAGLVRGTIPSSMRKGSGQLTLDGVLNWQGGDSAEKPK